MWSIGYRMYSTFEWMAKKIKHSIIANMKGTTSGCADVRICIQVGASMHQVYGWVIKV